MPRFDHTLWHEASLQEKWWTWTESLAFLCWEKSNTNWFTITAQSCRHEPQSSHGHKSLLIAGFTRVNSLDHSPWDNTHHLIHLILSKMLQLHTPHNVGKTRYRTVRIFKSWGFWQEQAKRMFLWLCSIGCNATNTVARQGSSWKTCRYNTKQQWVAADLVFAKKQEPPSSFIVARHSDTTICQGFLWSRITYNIFTGIFEGNAYSQQDEACTSPKKHLWSRL